MEWNNIQQGYCPKCKGILVPDGRMIKCEDCDFRARRSVMDDIVKGKNSKAYQNKIKRYESLKKRQEELKDKRDKSKELALKERKYNLGKMLRDKKITQAEYDSKMSSC